VPTNYCQELAYWFLRLHGFLLLDNFVMQESTSSAIGEIDLLAYRRVFVRQGIGDALADSHDLFKEMQVGFNPDGSWAKDIAILVECKGGTCDVASLERAFSLNHLRAGFGRIGVASPDVLENLALELTTNKSVLVENLVCAKLLVINEQRQQAKTIEDIAHVITTAEIDRFIKGRIQRYRANKRAAWCLFPKDLFQLMIWSERNDHE